MRKSRELLPKTGSRTALPRFAEELPQFWQPRFYDFNVYSHEKMNEKLDYMHANAVTRGLVENPNDWPWSSFSSYTNGGPGLLQIDFVDM
jgi:REP element-mobilizing transposase RayT